MAALLLLVVDGWVPRLVEGHVAGPPEASPVEAHTPAAVPGRPGVLSVRDDGYWAEFDADGFSYLPSAGATPLEVSLEAVDRGGHELALHPGPWTAEESAAAREVTPGVTERVTARDAEVEWDVVLASRPAGEGDLTVRGRLHGDAGAKPAGQHVVVDLAGGGGVRLGEVVVRDATGAELHRALPVVADGSVELRVPDRVLERAAYPLIVDPTLSGVTVAAPAGSRSWPSIAFEGGTFGNYLVVWQENVGGNFNIYGEVVAGDHSGKLGPLPIAQTAKPEFLPDVAWNGSSFLVVWEQEFSATGPDTDIRGQRVSQFGDLLGGEIPISVPTTIQRSPAVTAGGSDFFVTWHDTRTGNLEVFGARVNANGSVLDGGINISQSIGTSDTVPDVAWNGSTYMVTWEEEQVINNQVLRHAMVRLVGPTGMVGLSNAMGPWEDAPRDPAIASNGNRFLVVYEKTNASGGTDLRAANVSSTILVDFTNFAITTAPDTQTDPVVTYNGTYLVSWRDRREPPDPDVYANRVTNGDVVQDGNGFVVIRTSLDEDGPAVAPGPGGNVWGIAYESGAPGATSIHVRNASK